MISRVFAMTVIALLVMVGNLAALTPDTNEELVQSSPWQMTISLDAPKLVPPAVQWAIFDNDPVPEFKAQVKRMQDFHHAELARKKTESDKELTRNIQMTVSWDLGFHKVTGDVLYLLTGAAENPSWVTSNGPAGKKWVVTKIVQIKGKPICWCLPIEVKAGEVAEVKLTEDNVFDLAAAFDDTKQAEKKVENKPAEKESSPVMDLKKAIEDATRTSPQDEPAAHALYNQMIEALRKADSLSYVSHYSMEAKGMVMGDSIYRMWMKKPNYFRMEAESSVAKKSIFQRIIETVVDKPSTGGVKGILIGDGNDLWIYWPGGRPPWKGDESEVDKKTHLTSYMHKPAPLARHSIGHEACHLGSGMSMPVIDPSTFHGYTDSLQAYLDYVKGLGTEKVGDEECDKIEVSIMKHQRSMFLWLSKRDHLPRKMEEVVRVSYDIIIKEEWSSISINGEIPDTQFAWKPPEGWTEWKMPAPEERLLKPGTKAPEFELTSAEGTPIKLADYRGQIVWFYIWRAG